MLGIVIILLLINNFFTTKILIIQVGLQTILRYYPKLVIQFELFANTLIIVNLTAFALIFASALLLKRKKNKFVNIPVIYHFKLTK